MTLILKHASASRPSGEWGEDDYDVLADGAVVGRILKVHTAPVGTPWMWTLAFGHHEDRTPTHGYAATREAAMTGIRKKLAAGVRGMSAFGVIRTSATNRLRWPPTRMTQSGHGPDRNPAVQRPATARLVVLISHTFSAAPRNMNAT
jgi:hypothetical protein